MAAPVEQINVYYEDSVNRYTTSQPPLNKRGAFSGTIMPPTHALLQFNVKESKSVAGDFYYFHDEASDVAGYKKLLIAPSDTTKKSLTATLSSGDPTPAIILMGQWMTEPGVPGFTGTIPASGAGANQWLFNLRQRRTVDGENYVSFYTIRWYRYYYDEYAEPDPGWVLSGQIAFSIGIGPTNTEQTLSVYHSVLASTWGPNDRLVCKIFGNLDEASPTS